MTITLRDGFTLEVSAEAMDDWELLEALCEMDGGNISKLPFVLNRLLGAEEKAALTEHLRGENGRVKSTDMINAISEIFTGLAPAKKS